MSELKKRSRGVTTVSRQHQITVPIDALKSAGIRVGDRLRVSSTADGRIVLERQADRVMSFAGVLSGRLDPSLINGLRDEWD
ncbi:MAG: AbrB/MazE/SpoVT family DNA-binding domain-containing protein [Acidimicrobiia bacterium]